MTYQEGFRRVRVVAGLFFALGVVLATAAIVNLFDSRYMNSQPNPIVGFLGLIGIPLAILGALCWDLIH